MVTLDAALRRVMQMNYEECQKNVVTGEKLDPGPSPYRTRREKPLQNSLYETERPRGLRMEKYIYQDYGNNIIFLLQESCGLSPLPIERASQCGSIECLIKLGCSYVMWILR